MVVTVEEIRKRVNNNSSKILKQHTGKCSLRQKIKNGHGTTLVLERPIILCQRHVKIYNIKIDMSGLKYGIIIKNKNVSININYVYIFNNSNDDKIAIKTM